MKKPTVNGQIDKHIPIPSTRRRGTLKYPWDKMEVGDSFLATSKSKTPQMWANFKYAPKHWVARTTPEGIRVWRDK